MPQPDLFSFILSIISLVCAIVGIVIGMMALFYIDDSHIKNKSLNIAIVFVVIAILLKISNAIIDYYVFLGSLIR